jgi:hypothetical protein
MSRPGSAELVLGDPGTAEHQLGVAVAEMIWYNPQSQPVDRVVRRERIVIDGRPTA